MKLFQFFLLIVFSLPGCINNSGTGSSGTPSKDAFGDANHVVIVCQQELWGSPLGDSINYYFGSAYPILPQPEPLFDLRHMTYSDLIGYSVRRELRNYIFIGDLSNMETAPMNLLNELVGAERLKEHLQTSKVSNLITRNQWARGQQLFYILGKDLTDLHTRIRTSFPGISKQIRDFDQARIKATVYAAGKSNALSQQVEQRFQIKMDIPNDWVLASTKPGGYWFRKENEKSSANIILSKLPYVNTLQMSANGIKSIRDTLSRTFIRTDSPGDYMVINDRDLPMFIYQKSVDANYGIEARGIWETKLEYMGGPFQTYLIQTPAKDSLLYLDLFIYAPEMEKRDLMQQMEEIVRTLHFQ
ncbi:MAG: DUF4837 family protein [Saprospiraceae bacterium]|nr:DUF4837 family protein [Saprospiraceae bacterium]